MNGDLFIGTAGGLALEWALCARLVLRRAVLGCGECVCLLRIGANQGAALAARGGLGLLAPTGGMLVA
jgi:hypothetical protein